MAQSIVLGAGVGGLVAAAYLAQAGRQVLVLEAGPGPGGCAATFEHAGYTFHAGATTLSGLGPERPLGLVLEELGLAVPVLELHGEFALAAPSFRLAIDPDPAATSALLRKRLGPLGALWDEALVLADRAWRFFMRHEPAPDAPLDLARLLARRDTWGLLPALSRSTAAKLGAADPELARCLDACLLVAAQARAAEVPWLFGAMALAYLREPLYLPRGGLGGFCAALKEYLSSLQRRCLFGRRAVAVEPVDARKGGAGWRVRVDNGGAAEAYEAEEMVLACTLWDAARLVAGPAGEHLARLAARHSHPHSACNLYLGLEGAPPEDTRLYQQCVLKAPLTVAGADSFFVSLFPPDLKEVGPFAPPGHTALCLSCHADPAPWLDLEDEAYAERKARLTDELTTALAASLPELEGLPVTLRLAATPRTWARQGLRHRGLVGGLAHSFGVLKAGWPTGLTPFPGLYRVGDTVYPGQSVAAVAWGARRVVRAMLQRGQGVKR